MVIVVVVAVAGVCCWWLYNIMVFLELKINSNNIESYSINNVLVMDRFYHVPYF